MTLIVIIVLTAVTITSVYKAGTVDYAFNAAAGYASEEDKEKIDIAITKGKVQILETLLKPDFSYSEMPTKVEEILNNSDGQLSAAQIEDTDEYTVYRVGTKNGNAFNLKIFKTTGNYELEPVY